MTRAPFLLIALAAGTGLLAVGAGDAHAYNRKVEKACKGDYKRLCPAYKPGSAALRACMEAKSSEISNRCITTLIDEGVVGRGSGRRG